MEIFEVFIDIEPLEGCDLIDEDAVGAIVYFYVAAETLESLIPKMKQLLF